MKIKCMIDRTRYKDKPKDWQIGKVQNSLKGAKIDIKELSELLIAGCSFRPAFLNGKKQEDWISQQIIALDFDNNTTIEEELNRCKELNILPSFGYTSFSHTKEHHKFRLVFVLDEVVTNVDTINNIISIFKGLFTNADKQTFHLGRFFYGGCRLVYYNYDNVVNIKRLLTKYDNVIYNKRLGVLGVQDKDNIYNINSIVYPKNPPSNNGDINYNIQAIKKHNVDYLKSVLGINNDTLTFETQQQFLNYIFKIDLPELLGIDNPRNFKCIFHNDNNPSASIFNIEETGNYIYKCNSGSCGVSYNIIGCMERLGDFKSRPKTYRFIKDLFNLEIMDTDWQREQKEILLENLKAIHNGELEQNCPQAYKNNKNILRYLEQMHLIALDNIYNEKLTDNDGNVTFFASVRYIANKLNISPNSLGKVSDKLVVFTYHNLLNKLKDEEIPESLLDKSKHINAKEKNDKYKRVNYFSIPSYTYNLYNEIEEQGIKWKENYYTMKGVSREMFYRSEGKEVADKLYPQYNKITTKNGKEINRTTTKASDDRTNKIASIILSMINNKGYATEKEVVEVLQDKYGKTFVQVQLKRSLQELLEGYDLKRVRANKQIKEQLGITNKGYPFFIAHLDNKKGVY